MLYISDTCPIQDCECRENGPTANRKLRRAWRRLIVGHLTNRDGGGIVYLSGKSAQRKRKRYLDSAR